jgi:hypothetical protein
VQVLLSPCLGSLMECLHFRLRAMLEITTQGFGKVWCDNELYERVGFGYGSEQGGDLLIQETDRGLYLGLPDGRNFVIDAVDGLGGVSVARSASG